MVLSFGQFFLNKYRDTFSFVFRLLYKTGLLLLWIFRRVLFQQSEKHISLILIKSFGELSDQWGNFDSGEKYSFLPLECNILGPSYKSCQVSFRLNIIADSEISGSALEEWVGFLLDLFDSSFSFGSFALS